MTHYFIYNERISEPIVQTQVVNLLVDFNRAHPELAFRLFAFQNLYFWITERASRRQLIESARQAGLQIQVFPFALPTRGWLAGRLGMWLHRLLFKLTALVIPKGTIVCRGYLGTHLCAQVAKRRGFSVIGDPRSLYVRENIGTRWGEGDAKHRLWLDIERDIVRRARRLIVVNQAMAAYYAELPGARAEHIALIPIYSRPQAAPEASGKPAGRIRLIYVGSLSHSKWNDIKAYRKFFSALTHVADRIDLVLIVKHGGPLIEELREELLEMGLTFTLHISLSPEQVRNEMVQADVGLAITDAWEDAGARTGIKTIEYLASNLVVWTTRHFGDVAQIVKTTDTGFVFDSSTPSRQELTQALDDLVERRPVLKQKVQELYELNYSPASVLRRLHDIVAVADVSTAAG